MLRPAMLRTEVWWGLAAGALWVGLLWGWLSIACCGSQSHDNVGP